MLTIPIIMIVGGAVVMGFMWMIIKFYEDKQ
jgi:hypothetical protein